MPGKGKVAAEEKTRIAKACIIGEISAYPAADCVRVHSSVVDDWVRLYQAEGVQAVLPKKENRRYDPVLKEAMEGFWGILKREEYYGRRFTSREELVSMIENFKPTTTTAGYSAAWGC